MKTTHRSLVGPWNFLKVSLFGITVALSCFTGCDSKQVNEASPVSQSPAQSPPLVPDGSLLRPTFVTTLGTINAGTAFHISLPGQTRSILLTAIHLLGPDGGSPRKVLPAELPQVVKSVALKDCFDPSLEIANAGAPVVIPEAAALDDPSKAGDILAFWGSQTPQIHNYRLADAKVAKGTRVWLAAAVLEGAPATQRLHAATVAGLTQDGFLLYRYENPKLSIRATSGAPVLNSSGEVVAINLGGAEQKGFVYGVGNPVGRFLPYLESAIKRQNRVL
jgi:hypothetical protein